jgi:hypothetical protein
MSNAADPYQSFPAKPPFPAKPFKPSGTMQYMRSFHFVFENPKWITNVLFIGLCLLSTGIIPVIGQLVATGYQFEVLEALHRRPGSPYPDFDTNRLLDYLVRGFWVFLVGLLIAVVAVPILGGLLALVFAVGAAAVAVAGEEGAAIAAIVMIPIGFLVLMAASLALGIVSIPFSLRAGLLQDFGDAFDFGFAKQFVRNTWKEMALCLLFLMVAALLLMFVGMAMLCVGIYFTMSITVLMHAHLILQLYELHLARGGDPIPLKQVSA